MNPQSNHLYLRVDECSGKEIEQTISVAMDCCIHISTAVVSVRKVQTRSFRFALFKCKYN